MHRVELKVVVFILLMILFCFMFLMHRVELKVDWSISPDEALDCS